MDASVPNVWTSQKHLVSGTGMLDLGLWSASVLEQLVFREIFISCSFDISV